MEIQRVTCETRWLRRNCRKPCSAFRSLRASSASSRRDDSDRKLPSAGLGQYQFASSHGARLTGSSGRPGKSRCSRSSSSAVRGIFRTNTKWCGALAGSSMTRSASSMKSAPKLTPSAVSVVMASISGWQRAPAPVRIAFHSLSSGWDSTSSRMKQCGLWPSSLSASDGMTS